ncbi:MAG: DUF1772 domain-containing protein [Acidimicrobiia bacterium]|nr:DUF1772 domain-containing protein [Acidimicrobiia bacterium]
MTEYLTIAALIGAGLNAGVFFSFSTFTMSGLRRLEPATGAAAMQEINREAPKAPLMSLMFGTAFVSAALMVDGLQNLDQVPARYQFAAGVLFLVGVIMLTGMYHVPRNNTLDRLDPETNQGQRYWEIYRQQWTRMNHVRTIAPALAAVLLAISLIV